MNRVHVVIVTGHRYPDGGPAAIRHRALASGLLAVGHEATFLLLRQTELPARDGSRPSPRWVTLASPRAGSPIQWRFRAARRLRRALRTIDAGRRVDAVLLIDRDPVILTAGIHAARALGVPAVHEVTEFPDVVRFPGPLGALAHVYFLLRQLPALDGVLVISRAIQAYVARWTSAPVRLVGSIVDLDDARGPVPPLELGTELVVGYAGSLSETKDGVLTLIRAAARVSADLGPDLRVRIRVVGDHASPAGKAAQLESRALGMEDRVEFRGQVPHAEVPSLLAECHLLVLPRPVSRQATGGFPTKLAEYLATGRPVLTTAVGDIPRYLRDGETCLMAAPNDVDALARSLASAARDYDGARAIGARGRGLVERSFSAPMQASKVAEFLESLGGGAR